MKPSLRLSPLMILHRDTPVALAASLIEEYSLDPPSYMMIILFDDRGGFFVPLYSGIEKLPPSFSGNRDAYAVPKRRSCLLSFLDTLVSVVLPFIAENP